MSLRFHPNIGDDVCVRMPDGKVREGKYDGMINHDEKDHWVLIEGDLYVASAARPHRHQDPDCCDRVRFIYPVTMMGNHQK